MEGEAALPLRLSVGRGGIGIELSRAVPLLGLVVEELEIALVGLAFPIDLSRGVKQFRSRRGVLERLVLRADLEQLGKAWKDELGDLLGEPIVGVRLRASVRSGATSQDASGGFEALSVCIHSERRALAFDLVLAAGSGSRFVVDRARGVGLSAPATMLALLAIDRATKAVSAGASTEVFRRSGRSVELGLLAGLVCIEILPLLGCRVPEVSPELRPRIRFERGWLVVDLGDGQVGDGDLGEVHLGDRSEARPLGSRAVRLLGLAELMRPADDALASGDQDACRRLLLEALETAPSHPELLLALAELDGATGDRTESARGFLAEASLRGLDGEGAPSSDGGVRAVQAALVEARLLPGELMDECLARAASLETDAVLSALVTCARVEHKRVAKELTGVDTGRASELRALLDDAVRRAPFLERPRRLRLAECLKAGDLTQAEADASHLLAGKTSSVERGSFASEVAREMQRAGHLRTSVSWLRRALRHLPDADEVKLELGLVLAELGDEVRAAELLGEVFLRRSGQTPVRDDSGLERSEGNAATLAEDLVDRARLTLARVTAASLGDPRLALSHVKAVDSRSEQALAARRLEIQLTGELGDEAGRRRAVARLLEAIDLGWIQPEHKREFLVELALRERERGSEELSAFAERLAGVPTSGQVG